MKIMTRLLQGSIFLLLLMFLSYLWMDNESTPLDDAQRAQLGVDFIALQHGAVHYELSGNEDAETVVLVHGFSVPSYVWDRNVEALREAGYRVLRYDLYGRGFSARPEVGYNIELFVEQLDEITEKLSIRKPFHLVGLSMGGPITTNFAKAQPEKVKTLSLLAPLVETPDRVDLKLIKMPWLGEYLAALVMMPKIENNLANTVFDVTSYPQWHEQMAQHSHFKGYRRALLATARYLAGRTFIADYQALANTNIPTQLIWGRRDPVIPYEQGLRLAKEMPSSPFYTLENTGHLPQIEQSDAVNALLLNHFSP